MGRYFFRPGSIWRWRRGRWMLFAIGLGGVLITAMLFQTTRAREEQAIRGDFELRAQELAQMIERRVQMNFETVHALAGYFKGSEAVTWQEFQIFAGHLQDYYPGVNSLQWVPQVRDEQRQAHQTTPMPQSLYLKHEANEQNDLQPHQVPAPPINNYHIHELDDEGQRVPAAARPAYYPIYYVAPWRDGHSLWGLDLASIPSARRALEYTKVSGGLVATAPIHDGLVWVFSYVNRSEVDEAVAADEAAVEFDGFVAGAFQVDAIVGEMLAWAFWPQDVHLELWDEAVQGEPQQLYSTDTQITPARRFAHREQLELGNRRWHLRMVPSREYINARRSWWPPGMLFGGLTISGLLVALLASVQIRAERAQEEAADRAVRARQQAVVAELGLAALSEASLQTLMGRTCEVLAGTLGVEYTKVLELLPDGEKLLLRAGVGWEAGFVGHATVGTELQSQAGYTLQSDEPVVVEDLPRETRFNGPSLLRKHGVVSGMSAIIHQEHGPFGVLGVHSTRKRQFTANDIAFLQAVANVLGQAIVQRYAEAELRESEARFRMIADAAPALIWLAEPDKRLTYFNKQWLEFTGRPMAEEVDMGWIEGVHPEDREQSLKVYSEAFDRRASFRMQYRLRRADGAYRWLLEEAVPRFTPDGRFAGYIGLCVDVTDQKRAEHQLQTMNETLEQRVARRTAQLQQTTKALERSNNELEQFAYIASHDLQEPLRKVQGFAEMLRDHLGDSLDEQAADYQRRMFSATQRMRDLIDGLLTYSRVTTKTMPFGKVDLNEVAEEVVSDLELRIRETGGVVRLEALPTIHADRLQMRQLLQNLIGNGLKFHRPDVPPEVEVSAEPAPDAGADNHRGSGTPHCRIKVKDNGIGIDSKYVDRLFVPFQRLHGRSSPYEGTGIGLAVCRKIVERHGGTIHLKSTVGEGSTFIVTLPCHAHEREGNQTP